MKPLLSLIIFRGFSWEDSPENESDPKYWQEIHWGFEQLESEEKQKLRASELLADIILHKNPNLDLTVSYSEQNQETSVAVYKSCKLICAYLDRFENLPSVDLLKSLL